MRNFFKTAQAALLVIASSVATPALAQAPLPTGVVFENVRIFDGNSDRLSEPSNVLVVGNVIKALSRTAIEVPAGVTVTRVPGAGRTLMPGLIDAHTHIMFATVPQAVVLTSDIGYINVAAVRAANDMLMRGFTSIRDLGGPVFGLKRGIDSGLVAGPRIWPAGASFRKPAAMATSACRTNSRPRPVPSASANGSARRPLPTAPMRSATARASNWRSAPRRSS